ncbi:hypothetical protein KUTeg_016169 [Tegillarca granosa]|uniref:Uncharacterized protein n=1 Tax=Tegillarca granosa TaxID=220873 RepID=A0ABQ9EL59_TEGGR|nr:hypothetical protein KUTeg_016169 [Tegillarca granosa]
MDKHTASIELSNACRSLYFNRVQAAESFKEKMMKKEQKPRKQSTSIDSALSRLQSEMASLMDQDLSLMEQLLTMNESIEEIKTRRLYGVSKDSLEDSMDLITGSNDSTIST